MIRFGLDEDFPENILPSLSEGVPEVDLVPIRVISPRLRGMDDWELLLSLYHLKEWDGLITMNSGMLNGPKELAVLHQTKLTLVVVHEAGHDPIRATGLLLVHLPMICKKTVRTVDQIWQLSAKDKGHEDPWVRLRQLAVHQNKSVQTLYQESKLSSRELKKNPLHQLDFGPVPGRTGPRAKRKG